ncbi:MAG: divalent-cation tolerance protein CutA [Candidatus Midichloria sp.]|nr:MAG: divalent-cation tolerance protein CutA [Candidatus Midichloria sp.]
MLSKNNELIIFYTTISSKEEATFIAKKVIENQIPSCINIVDNVSSIYKWDGKLESAAEVIMLVKTLKVNSDKVYEIVKEYHSYSVPCIISFDAESHNPEYTNWLRAPF